MSATPSGGRLARLLRALGERFPTHKLNFESMVHKKEVPHHGMSWAYYFGGLTLFFFIIQVITGVMLLFYYEPSVSDAHTSVEYITYNVTGGALVRNLHAWSSSAMIFCALSHMITALSMKAFKNPREITWLSGVLLLLLVFGFGFTGYLLPWNQIAVNATKIGLQSIEQLGSLLPGFLADLLRSIKETIQGDAAVGQSTLSRFYAIHVVILPLLTFALLGLHLLAVQLHGMSKGVDKPTGKTERFFPTFVLKDFSLWGIVFFFVMVIAMTLPFESLFDYPLFAPYDALGSTPDGIKPEWYFYFVYYPLELLPFWMIIVGSTVAMGALVAAPWLLRGTGRKTLRVIALAIALYFVVITLFGQNIYEMLKGH